MFNSLVYKRIDRKIIISLSVVFIFIFSFVVCGFDLAAGEDRTGGLGGLEDSGKRAGYSEDLEGTTTTDEIAIIVGRVIAVILSLLGVIFLILVFMGAFDILGANGNEEHVKQGKERIKTGFSGMFFILVAYLLAQLLIVFIAEKAKINL